MRRFRHDYLNWFWGSYTAVYLGIAVAAYDELRRVMHTRQPQGYAQPLAYHPDVRRHIAELSADLEAARLITYRSAWLSDTQRTDRGDHRGAVPCEIRGRRGGQPHHPYRADARRRARHLQRLASRAVVPRRRDRHRSSRRRPISVYGTWGCYELGLDPADVLPPMTT